MSAKQQAMRDIIESLKEEHKAFIAFRKELNPIMEDLVESYIECQDTHKSWCLSGWSF